MLKRINEWGKRATLTVCSTTCLVVDLLPYRVNAIVDSLNETIENITRSINSNEPPGPLGWPVVGHLTMIDYLKPQTTFNIWAQRYGPIFKLQLGSMPVIVLTDPYDIIDAFNNPALSGKPPLFVTTGIMDGCGILSVDRNLWANQREIIETSLQNFQNWEVNGELVYYSIINRHVDLLLEQFFRKANGVHKFDAHPYVELHVSNMMSELFLGRAFHLNDPEFKKQLSCSALGSKLVNLFNPVNYFPVLRHWPNYAATYNTLRELKDIHHEFLDGIIQEHLDSGNEKKGLINFIIEEMHRLGFPVTDPDNRKQLLHVAADLFGIASKTVSTTIMWVLLHLTHMSAIQARVHAELDSAIGRNIKPRISQLLNLPFITACIFETQRKCNVAPFGLPHWTCDDVQIGPYMIPKNTMVIGFLYVVHTDKAYWRSPEMFEPDRFINPGGDIRDISCFMPYLVGQRQCLAGSIAHTALMTITGNLLQVFSFSPGNDWSFQPKEIAGLRLMPKDYFVRLIPRLLLPE